ncbi:ABC transporter substrate-binding protein [Kitasatospora cineracea]|uniref:Carbohydrate ABC transporter substrate-binding protein (CUT1 family) n=1 Tax=Kitasatospora cineracea TaxID=88074 RepID=A0A8G1UC82_9ACTN|nr:sugar ABC transporter substrate-binding protein [Kitasatospora cineracea]ROR38052.1 carbohydrate ABC transporter substrate-binding protein (CUT1 family) [Kitasatospora cineracea]
MSPAPARRRRLAALVPAAALVLGLTACGSSGAGSAAPAVTDPAAALDTPTTLTFWTWAPNIDKTVALFEQKYPKIKVNVVNAGQSATEYTKMQTAIKAGSGGPDVAQVEYFALPEFALSKRLVDLKQYGAAGLESKFTPSAWSQVALNGGVWAVPQDTGPMAMFYNQKLFDQLGLKPPTTWAEFEDVAVKIKASDPNRFITSIDPGDAGGLDSFIWQAGGRPFQQKDAGNVAVDLQDPGSKKVADLWSSLLQRKLVDAAPGWTNEWWQSMDSGRYAMWLIGAWAPGNIASTIPNTAKDWRVAPMPQWSTGDKVSAENGGSAVAVPTSSKHQAAAAAFAIWLNSDPEAVRSLNDNGLFPATTGLLTDPAFLDKPLDALGGQKANRILADSSATVGTGWQYLPYQVYANSVFKDTVGQSVNGGDLNAGLGAWQKRIADYGNQQGFKVTTP